MVSSTVGQQSNLGFQECCEILQVGDWQANPVILRQQANPVILHNRLIYSHLWGKIRVGLKGYQYLLGIIKGLSHLVLVSLKFL